MTMVGYDDFEQCWIVKNSWGNKWGDDGWFKMAYDSGMIIDSWYKNYDPDWTGVIYLDGVYGNFKPDVPKIQIIQPENFKTYIFGFEIF